MQALDSLKFGSPNTETMATRDIPYPNFWNIKIGTEKLAS